MCSNEPGLWISYTETRAVYKSEAFCFHISFCSYPYLWSRVLNNDRKSSIPSTGARNNFLQKVRGLYLLDKVKITDICQSLNIKPLLLRIEQLQLRWYDHETQIFHERTAKQLIDALPSGKRPRGRPRTRIEAVKKQYSFF